MTKLYAEEITLRPSTATTGWSDLGLAKRPPPRSREDFVYEALKEAILGGSLPPGQTLSQVHIAEQLGVSASPVRTAVSRLAAEGLMVSEPHRSPRVSGLSKESLEEILIIRMHLEELAAQLAIPRLTKSHLMELHSLMQDMKEALDAHDNHRYGVLNKEFHLRMYKACQYPLLYDMIRDLWDKSDMCRSRSMFSLVPGLAEVSHAEHLQLLELIEANLTDSAVVLLKAHKTGAREMFLDHIGPMDGAWSCDSVD